MGHDSFKKHKSGFPQQLSSRAYTPVLSICQQMIILQIPLFLPFSRTENIPGTVINAERDGLSIGILPKQERISIRNCKDPLTDHTPIKRFGGKQLILFPS